MLFAAFVFMAFAFEAKAEWEHFYSIRAPYCMHVTPEGRILVADYRFDGKGGIYYTDDGKTWTKSDAPDYTYGLFLDAGEYLIATGKAGRVARSADNGTTWEVTSYASAVADILDAGSLDRTISYGAAMHNGKLYVCDYAGAGVLYTEDFGETWKCTNIKGLQYEIENPRGEPGEMMTVTENLYNLVSYKGKLLAFGIYYIFEYDEANDEWTIMRSDSNWTIQYAVHNGLFVAGRSIMSQDDSVPFLQTYDGKEWGELPRPEGWLDNNVRCFESDGNALYIGFQHSGFMFTADNGETYYQMNEGLPATEQFAFQYQHIIDLTSDDKYVYAIIYDEPQKLRFIDGVYRISKEELLEPVGIESVNADNKIYSDGAYLHVGNCDQLTICDISGKTINVARNAGKADLQGLIPGVYLYNAITNGKSVSGKFIKK